MKTTNFKMLFFVLLSVLSATATSCQEEDPIYKVNNESLAPVIERFYAEASERGLDLKQDNLVIKKLPESSNQLISGEVTLENKQRVLYYSPLIYTNPTYQALMGNIELSIYSTLWSLHTERKGYVDVAKVKITDPSELSDEQIDRLFDMLNGTFVDEEED